jgi:hypothetical protein
LSAAQAENELARLEEQAAAAAQATNPGPIMAQVLE